MTAAGRRAWLDVGHSLGAKEALSLAAFDRRIRATVAHDGGLGRRQSNWEAEWYLGPGVPAGFDHHQLLALAGCG
jgi:pimeloyl-ACP methyl ester carboxylesterase